MGRALGTDGDVTAGQTGFVETVAHGDRLFPVSAALRNPVARLPDHASKNFGPAGDAGRVGDEIVAHLDG